MSEEAKPCALLCASSGSAAAGPPPSAPPEDESADPVGDGHSDADLAERKKRNQPPPDGKKPA